MIRSLALLSCASLALTLSACGSNGNSSGAGGSGASGGSTATAGSGGSGASGASGGAGGSGASGGSGGATCSTDTGTCAAPFTAPPAGTPDAACTAKERELAGLPAGTTLKKACSPYHVKDTATAEGHVTIEAGVHIQLADNAVFTVMDNGPSNPRSVDANGTACDPVVFEPDSPNGRFGYVAIGSTAPGDDKGNSHLHYVEFRGGASKPATLGQNAALLFLTGVAPALLDHVNIIDSAHYGLGLTNGQPLDPASNNIYVEGAADGPALVSLASSLAGFPTLSVGCEQQKTPEKGILVESAGVKVSTTWASQPVAFVFANADLTLSGAPQPTILTISAPNTLLFGTKQVVSIGGNGSPANIVADGDITFDAIDKIGGWKGFYIHGSANQDTVLRGGHIGHAGAIQGLGTKDGKSAYASVILTLSQVNPDAWPKIEKEDIHDANKAPPGANNESACMFIGPGSPGSEPVYEDATHANVFTNCGPVDVAHSDK